MSLRRVKVGPLDALVTVPETWSAGIRRARRLMAGGSSQDAAVKTENIPKPDALSPEASALWDEVHAEGWYHTIELPHGIVSPGFFDHRPYLPLYPLPDDLSGLRVLDVATYDGFWAFQMEKRGAAETYAVDVAAFGDIDLAPRVRARMTQGELAAPTGKRFELCHRLLRSKVKRTTISVYDISPENIGTFDLVFISDVLLHLQNPMKALANVRRVTRGQAVIVDVFMPTLPEKLMSYQGGAPETIWWYMSQGALEQMIWDAGFDSVELKNTFRFPARCQPEIDWWRAAYVAKP